VFVSAEKSDRDKHSSLLSVIDENAFYVIDTSIDLGLELLESVFQPVPQVVRGCLLLALVLVKNYQNFFFLRR
jgi:hypothetical protein